jgi:hypothetical protein
MVPGAVPSPADNQTAMVNFAADYEVRLEDSLAKGAS